MKQLNTILLLFMALFAVNGFSQTDTTGTSDADNEKKRIHVSKFLDEFFDVGMLDKSLQSRHLSNSREVKDEFDLRYNSEIDTLNFGVEVTIYTHLNIDHLWAKWLNPKWKYSSEGKIPKETSAGKYGSDFSLLLDTTSEGKIKTSGSILLTAPLKNYLAAKKIDGLEIELNDSINKLLTSEYNKPKDIPMSQIVEAVFDLIEIRIGPHMKELSKENQRLKDLFHELNWKRAGRLLSKQVKSNQRNNQSKEYYLDVDKHENSIFSQEEVDGLNLKLKALNDQIDADAYVITYKSRFVLDDSEKLILSKQILSYCKACQEVETSLMTVQAYLQPEPNEKLTLADSIITGDIKILSLVLNDDWNQKATGNFYFDEGIDLGELYPSNATTVHEAKNGVNDFICGKIVESNIDVGSCNEWKENQPLIEYEEDLDLLEQEITYAPIYGYICPSGIPFMPNSVDFKHNLFFPNGTLFSFQNNGISYKARHYKGINQFGAYIKNTCQHINPTIVKKTGNWFLDYSKPKENDVFFTRRIKSKNDGCYIQELTWNWIKALEREIPGIKDNGYNDYSRTELETLETLNSEYNNISIYTDEIHKLGGLPTTEISITADHTILSETEIGLHTYCLVDNNQIIPKNSIGYLFYHRQLFTSKETSSSPNNKGFLIFEVALNLNKLESLGTVDTKDLSLASWCYTSGILEEYELRNLNAYLKHLLSLDSGYLLQLMDNIRNGSNVSGEHITTLITSFLETEDGNLLMGSIPLETRVKWIALMVKYGMDSFWNDEEAVGIALVKSVPDDQVFEFHKKLQSKTIKFSEIIKSDAAFIGVGDLLSLNEDVFSSEYSLFQTLMRSYEEMMTTDDNFSLITKTFMEQIIKRRSILGNNTSDIHNHASLKTMMESLFAENSTATPSTLRDFYYWGEGRLDQNFKDQSPSYMGFQIDGFDVEVGFDNNKLHAVKQLEIGMRDINLADVVDLKDIAQADYDPLFDFVIIQPNENIKELGLKVDIPSVVPALTLYYLSTEAWNETGRTSLKVGIDVIATLSGVGGFVKAITITSRFLRIARLTFRAIEAYAGVTNLLLKINDEYTNTLYKNGDITLEERDEIFQYSQDVQRIITYVEFGCMGTEFGLFLKDLPVICSRLRTTYKNSKFKKYFLNSNGDEFIATAQKLDDFAARMLGELNASDLITDLHHSLDGFSDVMLRTAEYREINNGLEFFVTLDGKRNKLCKITKESFGPVLDIEDFAVYKLSNTPKVEFRFSDDIYVKYKSNTHFGSNVTLVSHDGNVYFKIGGVADVGGDWLTQSLLSKLDGFDNAILKQNFLDDFLEASTETKALLNKNPNAVDSWRALDNAGVDVALRKDPSWLNRVSNWTDEGLEVASEGRILKNGNDVGRIVGDRLHLKYSGFGGDVVCDPNKTTTLLGKWKDPACGGTCELIDSRLSKSGQNPGGANVLSEEIPSGWTDQQIWDNVNEPWLREAANRSDVIRVVSDPTKRSNIYKQGTDLSFFGREHELLTKPVSQGGLGYTYNSSTFTYTK